jgi:hypothetical protein
VRRASEYGERLWGLPLDGVLEGDLDLDLEGDGILRDRCCRCLVVDVNKLGMGLSRRNNVATKSSFGHSSDQAYCCPCFPDRQQCNANFMEALFKTPWNLSIFAKLVFDGVRLSEITLDIKRRRRASAGKGFKERLLLV